MVIGRHKEISLLKEVLDAPKAKMITVIGRRGIGKTFLIDNIYKEQIIFKQTGVRNESKEAQLRIFTQKLEELAGTTIATPKDWLDAFFLLKKHIKPHLSKKKKVVLFFDELSWLAGSSSNFLDYLGHFWNDWAYQQNLVIVLCGSTSSWIIKKVINDKGGCITELQNIYTLNLLPSKKQKPI